ncbi:Protein C2-DOMAIN ABA-RELATED 11 [Diplonema papillatum]|nr:Protein C2-DOMAIN ABA-RELATED 11 [Diplonema papillatum]
MAYKKAKNFREAHKHAMANNLPGGSLTVEVIECSGLRPSDANGKSDVIVELIFSTLTNQQNASTETVNRTLNPKFKKNKFEFNIIKPVDKLQVRVFDRDYIPYRKEVTARSEVELGEGTVAGTSGTLNMFLHVADAPEGEADAYVEDTFGTCKISFYYNFSESANVYASVDLTAEPEEEFEWRHVDQLVLEINRFGAHVGHICNPLWYWLDTCMWKRPFETIFWCVLLTSGTFVFDNVLSAFFPALMLVLFIRSYVMLQVHGYKGPPEEPYVAPTMKETCRQTMVNLRYYSDLLDYWHEIYAWKRKDTAMILTKFFAGWTFAVLFLPIPYFRYWFWLGMLYMYTLYPMYTNAPRLMYAHSAAVSRYMSLLTIYNLERLLLPVLPDYIAAYLPKSHERIMEERVNEKLPPIPQGDMTYDEWLSLNADREMKKSTLELQNDGFLNEMGIPVCKPEEGRLHVKVVSATGFTLDAGGTCDAFVEMSLGLQHFKTKVMASSSTPVWDEDFIFNEVGYLSGVLSIEVFDKNKFRSDLSLGTCQVKLEEVVRDMDKLLELPLAGGTSHGMARIALKLKGTGGAWPNARQSELLLKKKKALDHAKNKALTTTVNDNRRGSLHVVLCHGSGLKICDYKTSDPYCVLSLRGHDSSRAPKKSSVKQSTLKPVWNEEFDFQNVTANMVLVVKVYDQDKIGSDDFMGEGSTLLDKLFEDDDEEAVIKLTEDTKPTGEITVRLTAEGFGRTMPTHSDAGNTLVMHQSSGVAPPSNTGRADVPRLPTRLPSIMRANGVPTTKTIEVPSRTGFDTNRSSGPDTGRSWVQGYESPRIGKVESVFVNTQKAAAPAAGNEGGAMARAPSVQGSPEPRVIGPNSQLKASGEMGGARRSSLRMLSALSDRHDTQMEVARNNAVSRASRNATGKISVTVISARKLKVVKDNPEFYVKVLLSERGGQTFKFKTRPVAAGTLHPVWNVPFTFQELPSDALSRFSLQVEVWDQSNGTNTAIAAGTCNLQVLSQHPRLESWVTVYSDNEEQAGEVRVLLVPEGLQ